MQSLVYPNRLEKNMTRREIQPTIKANKKKTPEPLTSGANPDGNTFPLPNEPFTSNARSSIQIEARRTWLGRKSSRQTTKTNKRIILKSTSQILELVGNEVTAVRTRTPVNKTITRNKMYFCVENELYTILTSTRTFAMFF